MSKFAQGDTVTIQDRAGAFEVYCGDKDCDGDIKVYHSDKSDWFYVNESRCSLAPSIPAPLADGASSAPKSSTLEFTKSEGNTEMAKASRRTVQVQLIDEDAGLDVQFALVKDFGSFVTEDNDATLIQEIILTQDVTTELAAHNAIRAEQVNLDVKQRTGQVVKLDPVKLKDLKWIVK